MSKLDRQFRRRQKIDAHRQRHNSIGASHAEKERARIEDDHACETDALKAANREHARRIMKKVNPTKKKLTKEQLMALAAPHLIDATRKTT